MATATDDSRVTKAAPPTFTDTEVLDALAAPFEPHQIRVRDVGGGKRAKYITPRTCRERLNLVLGPANWETKVQQLGAAPGCSVLCHLTVHLPSGRSVTRGAVGSLAAMYPNKPLNQSKSSDSDAFKRACKMFGIGENLEDVDERNGPARGVAPRREQAPPARSGGSSSSGHGSSHSNGSGHGNPPRSCKALYPWLKNLDEQHANGAGVFEHVAAWGQSMGFPRRFDQYSDQQVGEAVAEALAYVANPGAADDDGGY